MVSICERGVPGWDLGVRAGRGGGSRGDAADPVLSTRDPDALPGALGGANGGRRVPRGVVSEVEAVRTGRSGRRGETSVDDWLRGGGTPGSSFVGASFLPVVLLRRTMVVLEPIVEVEVPGGGDCAPSASLRGEAVERVGEDFSAWVKEPLDWTVCFCLPRVSVLRSSSKSSCEAHG